MSYPSGKQGTRGDDHLETNQILNHLSFREHRFQGTCAESFTGFDFPDYKYCGEVGRGSIGQRYADLLARGPLKGQHVNGRDFVWEVQKLHVTESRHGSGPSRVWR